MLHTTSAPLYSRKQRWGRAAQRDPVRDARGLDCSHRQMCFFSFIIPGHILKWKYSNSIELFNVAELMSWEKINVNLQISWKKKNMKHCHGKWVPEDHKPQNLMSVGARTPYASHSSQFTVHQALPGVQGSWAGPKRKVASPSQKVLIPVLGPNAKERQVAVWAQRKGN